MQTPKMKRCRQPRLQTPLSRGHGLPAVSSAAKAKTAEMRVWMVTWINMEPPALPTRAAEPRPSTCCKDRGWDVKLAIKELQEALKLDEENPKIKAALRDAQLTWEADFD